MRKPCKPNQKRKANHLSKKEYLAKMLEKKGPEAVEARAQNCGKYFWDGHFRKHTKKS